MTEIRVFLGILIYRSLFPYSRHRDLWNLDIKKLIYIGLMHIIGYNCFLQLEASLHVSNSDIKEDMFSKLKPINLMLLDTYKVLWHPSSALAVDKCISRFTGRLKKMITIPSKLIPTGIKN